MNKPAAIYARVSSDRQKENQTIASQTSALKEYAESHGYLVPAEWVFQDEGYSGASLIRPGLEALRDLAAQGRMVATFAEELTAILFQVANDIPAFHFETMTNDSRMTARPLRASSASTRFASRTNSTAS